MREEKVKKYGFGTDLVRTWYSVGRERIFGNMEK